MELSWSVCPGNVLFFVDFLPRLGRYLEILWSVCLVLVQKSNILFTMRPQKSSLKLINVFVRGKIDFYKVGEGYWMMVPKSFSQDLSIISHVCFVSSKVGVTS